MRFVIAALVLFALLAGGFFVLVAPNIDPKSVEQQVTSALGQRGVSVRRVGNADTASLFPRPAVALHDVVLEGPDQSYTVQADRIEMVIDPGSIIVGKLTIESVRIVRPRLAWHAASWPGGAEIPTLGTLPEFEIVDGTIDVPGSIGETPLHIDDLTARGSQTGLNTVIEASADFEGETLSVSMSVGASDEADFSPWNVDLSTANGLVLDARGSVSLALGKLRAETNLKGPRADHFASRMAELILSGAAPLEEVPEISASAVIERAPGAISLTNLEATIGTGRVRGSIELDRNAEPRLDVDLRSNGFRIEKRGVPLTARIIRNLTDLGPLDGSIVISGTGLEIGDQTVQSFDIKGTLEPRVGVRIDEFSATTTIATNLQIEGLLSVRNGEPGFNGSLVLTGPSLRELVGEFDLPIDDIPREMMQAFEFRSQLDLQRQRLVLEQARLRMDTSRIEGSLALMTTGRPTLAVSASIDRLGFDSYLPPDWTQEQLWSTLRRLISLGEEADIAAELTVDAGSFDALRARDITLRGSVQSGALTLAELSVRGSGDSAAQVVGTADLETGTFDFALDASAGDPARLLRSAGVAAPPTLSEFGPLRLDGTTRRSSNGDDIEVALTAPGIDIEFVGTIEAWQSLNSHRVRTTGRLDNFAELAALFGADELSRNLPAGALEWEGVSEELLGVHSAAIQMGLGQTSLAGELEIDDQPSVTAVTGFIVADELPAELLGPMRRGLLPKALVELGLGELALGKWPNAPITLPRDFPIALRLSARADTILQAPGTRLPGGQLVLELQNGRLAISDIVLPLANGALEGSIVLTNQGDTTSLESTLRISEFGDHSLLNFRGDGIEFPEVFDLAVNMTSQGPSMAALVDRLAGRGHLEIGGRQSEIVIKDGIASTSQPLDLRFDLYAWIMEGSIDLPNLGVRRILGPPGELLVMEAAFPPEYDDAP